ncbi:MAG: GntR family transcriptional regulator [bacterium]
MARRAKIRGNVPDYSLRGRIYTEIRDKIIAGEYKTGDNLVELKLAEEYGVSRTPIREALLQLEQEGLVRYEPNRGVVVLGISNQDIQDIYVIRRLIEGVAAYWAASRATPEELESIAEVVDLIEFYTGKGDIEHITELDVKFHNLILEASKSRPLKQALGSFMHYIQRARTKSLKVPGRPEESLKEHKAILAALQARDPEKAQEAMTQHVASVNYNLPPEEDLKE